MKKHGKFILSLALTAVLTAQPFVFPVLFALAEAERYPRPALPAGRFRRFADTGV